MENILDLIAAPRPGDLDNGGAPVPPAAEAELLDASSRAVVGAAERVGPAVVSVEVRQRVERRGRPPREPPGPASGFGFTPDGSILPKRPLAHRAPRIDAPVSSGRRQPAAPVADDPGH